MSSSHIETHIAHAIAWKYGISNADARDIATYVMHHARHNEMACRGHSCDCRISVIDTDCSMVAAIDTKFVKEPK